MNNARANRNLPGIFKRDIKRFYLFTSKLSVPFYPAVALRCFNSVKITLTFVIVKHLPVRDSRNW